MLKPIAIGEEITAHYGDGYCMRIFLLISDFFLMDFSSRNQSVAKTDTVSVLLAKRMAEAVMLHSSWRTS